MKAYDAVVCVAGWEDRFVEGLKRDLNNDKPRSLIMFIFEEFASDTEKQRTHVLNYAWFKGIETNEVKLQRESRQVWRLIKSTFGSEAWQGKKVLVDITTMPREVIWWTITALIDSGCEVSYVYHHPDHYSSTWLTRDTATPKLVYQHSGISKLGKPTALVLLNGFDNERAEQLVQYFEPRLLLLGCQAGEQFDNEKKNREQSRSLAKVMKNIIYFEIDAFSSDVGFSAIESAVQNHLKDFNFIGASLGPKTSAISLLQLAHKYPDIALAYAPSRQFNPEYSLGIGKTLEGVVDFHIRKSLENEDEKHRTNL